MDEGTVRDMTNRIARALDAKIQIREKRGGAGQIVISFENRMHLNELVDKITG